MFIFLYSFKSIFSPPNNITVFLTLFIHPSERRRAMNRARPWWEPDLSSSRSGSPVTASFIRATINIGAENRSRRRLSSNRYPIHRRGWRPFWPGMWVLSILYRLPISKNWKKSIRRLFSLPLMNGTHQKAR